MTTATRAKTAPKIRWATVNRATARADRRLVHIEFFAALLESPRKSIAKASPKSTNTIPKTTGGT